MRASSSPRPGAGSLEVSGTAGTLREVSGTSSVGTSSVGTSSVGTAGALREVSGTWGGGGEVCGTCA
jgi:hypothetical protein